MSNYECYIKGYALPELKVGSSAYVVVQDGKVICSLSKLYSCPETIEPLKFHFYCELLAAREALRKCTEKYQVKIYTSEVIISNWLMHRCKKKEYSEWIDVIKKEFSKHENVEVNYYKNGCNFLLFQDVQDMAHQTAHNYKTSK